MNAQLKGAKFEKMVYYSISKALNPHKLGDILHYAYKPKDAGIQKFQRQKKDYYIMNNIQIGGHQTDLAIVDNDMLELIEKKATEQAIGQRKKGELITIECKDYERNIKAKFGTDLVAKNYFLNPNYSIIIKSQGVGGFNWDGNSTLACAERLEYNPFVGGNIINFVGKKNITPQYYEPVFEIFNQRLASYIENRKYYPQNTGLEELMLREFPKAKFVLNLKNFVPCPSAKSKTVIDFPAVALTKDGLVFAEAIKNIELADARHMMGYCLMTQASGVLYYADKITKNAEEYIISHNDIIKAKKI
jgi:hypothetical protein